MSQTDLAQFGKIDQTDDATGFIRFLDEACAAESFQVYKRQLLAWMDLAAGSRAIDVGCGTGDDVRDMAEVVGVAGRVIGVDNSAAMIEEARRRAPHLHQVEFQLAEGTALPFPDGSFDAARADRSLMHVPDPSKVLSEMFRVTRDGGRIVVYEVDFETAVIDVADRGLARKITRTWCDSVRDGWLGRRFPGLFAAQGLKEVKVVPHTLLLPAPLALSILGSATAAKAVEQGCITCEEGETWLQHLDELQRQRRFFASLTGFLVAGLK